MKQVTSAKLATARTWDVALAKSGLPPHSAWHEKTSCECAEETNELTPTHNLKNESDVTRSLVHHHLAHSSARPNVFQLRIETRVKKKNHGFCKIPGVCCVSLTFARTCFLKARLSQGLSSLVVVCRRSSLEQVVGHRPSLSGTGVPWVSCLDPPVCLRVQDDPEAKSQPVVLG